MAPVRPGSLPPDGTVVVAMTATHYDDDRRPRQVSGPLVTWWVAGLDYWQTVVAGECVDPSTIRVARDDETTVGDNQSG